MTHEPTAPADQCNQIAKLLEGGLLPPRQLWPEALRKTVLGRVLNDPMVQSHIQARRVTSSAILEAAARQFFSGLVTESHEGLSSNLAALAAREGRAWLNAQGLPTGTRWRALVAA